MAKDKAAQAKDKEVERTGSAAWQSALDRFDRFFAIAGHESVFAPPVEAGGRTVISAAEVMAGFGGGGGGSFRTNADPAAGSDDPERRSPGEDFGLGSAGAAYSRPVAVIVIDGDGVRVEPVVDATKIALAGLTAFGSMLFMLARMWLAYRSMRE